MANYAFVSFIYQFIEFAFSMIELLFAQLLPTLALLVGASLQFIFDFLLSFCYPNRPSSSLLNFNPSNGIIDDDDEFYTDADEDTHNYSNAGSQGQTFDTNHEEPWWPTQTLSARARASHQESSTIDGFMRREYFDRRLDSNSPGDYSSMSSDGMMRRDPRVSANSDDDRFRIVDATVQRTLGDQSSQRFMSDPSRRGLATDGMLRRGPRGNSSRLNNERLIDASGIVQNNRSIHRNDPSGTGAARRHVPPHRHMGLSRQSPSRPISHASALLPSSSSSTWLTLRRSIKKYAAKFSAFFMSRIWRQSNDGRRPWEHQSLLQSAW